MPKMTHVSDVGHPKTCEQLGRSKRSSVDGRARKEMKTPTMAHALRNRGGNIPNDEHFPYAPATFIPSENDHDETLNGHVKRIPKGTVLQDSKLKLERHGQQDNSTCLSDTIHRVDPAYKYLNPRNNYISAFSPGGTGDH